jgi:hypothetical protein
MSRKSLWFTHGKDYRTDSGGFTVSFRVPRNIGALHYSFPRNLDCRAWPWNSPPVGAQRTSVVVRQCQPNRRGLSAICI